MWLIDSQAGPTQSRLSNYFTPSELGSKSDAANSAGVSKKAKNGTAPYTPQGRFFSATIFTNEMTSSYEDRGGKCRAGQNRA
jgi:hypothetical protein